MTAFFFETRNPSEPDCRVISMSTVRWASNIEVGHDFIANPVEPKVIGLEKPYKRLADFVLTGAGERPAVISGILHVLKVGCRWCDCPAE